MSRLVLTPFFLAVVLALACDSSTPGPGQVRVANLIPDGPSAIDVCIKPDSTAVFGTPLIGGGGLSYPQLSTRTGFDAGTYSVRFVQGGSTSCASSLNGLGDQSMSISADAPQIVVPAGAWFGALPAPGSRWTLAGCTVSPGFEFSTFELGETEALLAAFPLSREAILALQGP